jgi:two-component system, OmpR family, response regulator
MTNPQHKTMRTSELPHWLFDPNIVESGCEEKVILPVNAVHTPFTAAALILRHWLWLPLETRVRLLVVEDDPDLNRQLTTALTDAGYVVDRAFDGEEGHFLGDSEPYDAVVLDIGLPKMDGISVLEAWRRNGRSMPVLILTARDRWSDKVQGFDAGADDYVAKPFHLEEILARIRALLRRSTGHAQSELTCGPVSLDTRTGRVSVSGNPIKMTSHEYRLLAYLMHHTGRVVSRTELVEHLYDQDFDRDSNTIEVFVGRIRKKLEVDIIQTVRGLGYLLTPPAPGS